MDFDWKALIKTVAPGLATALGGPLAGMAVSAIGNALGVDQPTQENIAARLAGATPADLLAVKQADQQFIKDMKQLDIDLVKIEADDRDSARRREAAVGDKTNRNLAYAVIGAFIAVVIGTLWGKTEIDTVLAGTLIGYLSAKAEQVLAYYFGSTRGSEAKSKLLAEAPAAPK